MYPMGAGLQTIEQYAIVLTALADETVALFFSSSSHKKQVVQSITYFTISINQIKRISFTLK